MMTSNAERRKGIDYDLIPHNPLGTVPDDLPDENPGLYRLIIAKRAIIAGYEAGENDPEACIADPWPISGTCATPWGWTLQISTRGPTGTTSMKRQFSGSLAVRSRCGG